MSEAKHTPEPWSLVDVDTLDGERVCVVGGPRRTRLVTFGPRKNWDAIDAANAALIVAAPPCSPRARLSGPIVTPRKTIRPRVGGCTMRGAN